MVLTMTINKGAARFEVSDGEVESTVTINISDEPDAVVRKLRRVVELLEGGTVPPPWNPATDMKLVKSRSVAISAPPELGEKQITNGWAMIDDPLPEAP